MDRTAKKGCKDHGDYLAIHDVISPPAAMSSGFTDEMTKVIVDRFSLTASINSTPSTTNSRISPERIGHPPVMPHHKLSRLRKTPIGEMKTVLFHLLVRMPVLVR